MPKPKVFLALPFPEKPSSKKEKNLPNIDVKRPEQKVYLKDFDKFSIN